MDPTQETFTQGDLANADPKDVEFLLHSRGYTNFFQPLLLGIVQSRLRQLIDPRIERINRQPDDFLRGAIATAEALLNAPAAVLAAHARRAQEERDVLEETKRYDEASLGGQYGRPSAAISPTDPIG